MGGSAVTGCKSQCSAGAGSGQKTKGHRSLPGGVGTGDVQEGLCCDTRLELASLVPLMILRSGLEKNTVPVRLPPVIGPPQPPLRQEIGRARCGNGTGLSLLRCEAGGADTDRPRAAAAKGNPACRTNAACSCRPANAEVTAWGISRALGSAVPELSQCWGTHGWPCCGCPLGRWVLRLVQM